MDMSDHPSPRDYWDGAVSVIEKERRMREELKRKRAWQRENKKAWRRLRRAALRDARRAMWTQLLRSTFWTGAECPTPGLQAFRDMIDSAIAAEAMQKASNGNSLIRGYRCDCLYWHVELVPNEESAS